MTEERKKAGFNDAEWFQLLDDFVKKRREEGKEVSSRLDMEEVVRIWQEYKQEKAKKPKRNKQ